MKKFLSVLISVATLLCLGVLLASCGGGGGADVCTEHTYEVSVSPKYDTVGTLKCKNCTEAITIPALKDREQYFEGSMGNSSYTVTYVIGNQRFSFEQSFFIYEDIGSGNIAITDMLGKSDAGIEIPETIDGKTVTKIKSSAFNMARQNGWQLLCVKIPATVTEIEGNILSGLTWIQGADHTRVEFPLCFTLTDLFGESVPTEISQVVFNAGDTVRSNTLSGGAIYSYVIPASVTKIEADAFYPCADRSGISVYYLGTLEDWCKIEFESEKSNPFFRVDSSTFFLKGEGGDWAILEDVVIPDTVTEIKSYAFVGFPANKIIISDSVVTIADYAFLKSKATYAYIPDSVKHLGASSFAENYNLATVILGCGIENMGRSPFYYTKKVKNLYFTGTADQLQTLKYHESISVDDGVLWRFSTIPSHVYSETVDIAAWSLGNSGWHYDEEGNPVIWDIWKLEYYFGNHTYNYTETEIIITDEEWAALLAKKGTDELSGMLADYTDVINAFNESASKEEFISKAKAVFAAARGGSNIQFGKNGIKDCYTDSRLTGSKDFEAVCVDGVWGAYSYADYVLYLTEVSDGTIAVVGNGYAFTVSHIYNTEA